MKVLQGFIDIGGQANRYSRAIRLQGHYSESWFYERTLREESYDRLLDFSNKGLLQGRLRKLGYLKDALKFNVWHIHKGFSMFHNARDLWIAKKLGIKIVIHYRGREIRPQMDMSNLSINIIEKLKRENEIADKIFVKDGQLAELISPYVDKVELCPNIVRVDNFIPPTSHPLDYFEVKRKLRVVHVPSNTAYKGTLHVRQAVQTLTDVVEYVELSNLSHQEVLFEYWKSDIVIDQLLTGTYGNASLEAMALGRCVINYLDPRFTKFEPEVPPIIHSTKDALAEQLRILAENKSLVQEKGKDGVEFIKRNHTLEKVGVKLIKSYLTL